MTTICYVAVTLVTLLLCCRYISKVADFVKVWLHVVNFLAS